VTKPRSELFRKPIEWNLSGNHGGGVHFAVFVCRDTGVVSGAVFVEAEGKVRPVAIEMAVLKSPRTTALYDGGMMRAQWMMWIGF
jgi:hypothetical protein